MAKKEVRNVELKGGSAYSDWSLSCVYGDDNARYHVWLSRDTLELRRSSSGDATLYKNAGRRDDGTLKKRGDAGHFHTRKLDADGAIGRIVVPAMLAKVPELLPAAKQRIADADAAEEGKYAIVRRKNRMTDCAAELYALVLLALDASTGSGHWRERARLVKNYIETGKAPIPPGALALEIKEI
jgi:hypothetical protein